MTKPFSLTWLRPDPLGISTPLSLHPDYTLTLHSLLLNFFDTEQAPSTWKRTIKKYKDTQGRCNSFHLSLSLSLSLLRETEKKLYILSSSFSYYGSSAQHNYWALQVEQKIWSQCNTYQGVTQKRGRIHPNKKTKEMWKLPMKEVTRRLFLSACVNRGD